MPPCGCQAQSDSRQYHHLLLLRQQLKICARLHQVMCVVASNIKLEATSKQNTCHDPSDSSTRSFGCCASGVPSGEPSARNYPPHPMEHSTHEKGERGGWNNISCPHFHLKSWHTPCPIFFIIFFIFFYFLPSSFLVFHSFISFSLIFHFHLFFHFLLFSFISHIFDHFLSFSFIFSFFFFPFFPCSFCQGFEI